MIVCGTDRSFNALPPEHQRAREIEAILTDLRMGERIVAGIEKVNEGYLVETEEGERFFVRVNYLPSGIGPAKFELEFP